MKRPTTKVPLANRSAPFYISDAFLFPLSPTHPVGELVLENLDVRYALPFGLVVTVNLALAIIAQHLRPLSLTAEQHAMLAYVKHRGGCLRSELLTALHITEESRAKFSDCRLQLIELADRGALDREMEGDDVRLRLMPLGVSLLEASEPLLAAARAELATKMPARREFLGPQAARA